MSTGSEPAFASVDLTSIPSKPSRAYARAIWTSIVSSILPGLGQLIQGQTAAGALWLGSFAGAAILMLSLRVFSTWRGYTISTLVLLAFICASTGHTFFTAATKEQRNPPGILILLPLAFALAMTCFWLAFLLMDAGFRTYRVPSTAMQPTIEKGDHVMADLHAYLMHAPNRGDIAVIRRGGIVYLKRVIGLPGETISIDEGVVSLNHQRLDESYVQFGDAAPFGRDFPETSIPSGYYFVMGDARDIALDSRSKEFGLVKREEIKGRVLYVANSTRTGRRTDLSQPSPVPGGSRSQLDGPPIGRTFPLAGSP